MRSLLMAAIAGLIVVGAVAATRTSLPRIATTSEDPTANADAAVPAFIAQGLGEGLCFTDAFLTSALGHQPPLKPA